MGTTCDPLKADLFLYRYARDFMDFLNCYIENQADDNKPFNLTSRYLDDNTNMNVMRQYACLVFNPIIVVNYAAFFNCTPVGQTSDSMMAPT